MTTITHHLAAAFLIISASLAICEGAGPDQPNGRGPDGKIVRIQFGSPDRPLDINPLSEAFFHRKLEKAEQLGATIVIIEIDSPGGYVESSINMAQTLRDIQWAKTVAFIPREALSGAAIMALGCDEIVMNKNGNIGDAGPIFMGEDFLFRHAPEKIRSDLVRKVRDLSEATGRPPAVAEAMVDMDLEVFKVTHADTGEVTYKSNAELEALDDPTEWIKGALLEPSKKGSFLEVNGTVAAEIGLANGLANSRATLAARFNKDVDEIIVLESTWVDSVVMVLNFWPVTAALFVVGLIAIYIELAAPGIGIGALVSGLCFTLFFWSRFLGGTAGWLEVVLFGAGVAFLLMELFVIPGFGVAGFTGVLLLMGSLVMATQQWGAADGVEMADLTNAALWVTGAGVSSVVAMIVLSKYFGGASLFKHLTLEPPPVTSAGTLAAGSSSQSPTEVELAVGEEGIADSALRPAGRVLFGDRFQDVVTDGSFVDKGSRVRIIKLSGTHITVREIS